MNNKRMEQNQQTPPAMEAFEQRLLLAGNVLAEITGAGDLIITGDDAANQIVITEVDGTVTITKLDADTSINGDEDIPGTGVELDGIFSRNIKIKMGDGDDIVNIEGDDGVDPFDPGDDDRFEIGGNIQIDLGAGTEVATDQEAKLELADVAGSVKITTKDANANAGIISSTIGKNVQIDLGGGNNGVVVIDSTFAGNLKIANKDGEANVYVFGSDVGGSVSVANGKGLYNVEIRDSLIGKNLSIKNKELVTANPALRQAIKIYETDIAGSVKISNGKGASEIDIDDFDDNDTNGDNVTIGKKLSISSKDGDDTVWVWNTTATGVKVSTGKGGDGTTGVYVSGVTTGSLAVANKSGVTEIEVIDTTVTKKTKLTGGKAETTVNVWDLVATGGLQIKGGGKAVGDGVLDVNINYLTGGAKSKVSITGGGDADILNIDDITIDSLQIKTGAGADIIDIETNGTLLAVVSTLDTLKISTGDGDDTVTIGSAAGADRGLSLTGKGNLDGGKGDLDTLDAAAARGNTFDEDLISIKNFELGDSIV